jgi:peptide chain release factor 1
MPPIRDDIRDKLSGKLDELNEHYGAIERQLVDPQVVADSTRLTSLAQERARLAPFSAMHARLQALRKRRDEAAQTLSEAGADAELEQLAREEMEEADGALEGLFEELADLLVSDAEGGDRNAIMEIRAGTGGEEAALFAADLMRMYTRYAEKHGWQVEPMSISATDLGGMREAILSVSGRGVWRKLRYESGGHRVQRVPETESQGRIHTSLATVAVLPEAREVEVEVRPEDVEMSFMRSGGPGGQSVNKTSSSVRLVHKPTGITVRCQDEKSQQANRKKAMKLLRAKLYEIVESERQQKRDALRRSQVGSGDRNERIRTYNFPQDRITDHRAGIDIFGIQQFMLGDCDRLFDALAAYDREQRLKAL